MEKYFITDDTALAAYLYLCGCEFIEGTIPNRRNYRRKKYVIINSPDITRLEEEFYLRKVAVMPLDYHDARVRVSRFLKKEITDPRFSRLDED